MILGITGGIATGKSTVSKMFQEKGAILIDADQISREVVEPGTIGLMRIVELFGDHVLQMNGYLNREALGRIIFHDSGEKRKLDDILHPMIRDKIIEKTADMLHAHKRIVVWDIPLLIENGMTSLVDSVVLVYTRQGIQQQRLIDRNHLSRKDALARIQSQIDIEEKKSYADFIIDNQGSIQDTQRQVDQIWLTLKREG